MNNYTDSPILFLHKYSLSETLSFNNKSFDFIYVLSGEISLNSFHKNANYPSGSICMLNPCYAYTLSYKHDNVILHIGIEPDYFYKHLLEDSFLVCDSVSEPSNDYTNIKNLLISIASKYVENPDKNRLSIQGLLLLLLDELKNNSQSLLTKEQLANIPTKYHGRILQMIEYIHFHYQEPLSLSEFADALFLSSQYISSFLKKYMNTSFKKLLNKNRLFHAERDLRFTDLSITEIAIQNGFSNTNTFYKNFCTVYKMSPQEYKKSVSNTYHNTDGRADFYVDDRTFTQNVALSHSQVVTVNMLNSGHIQENICTLINIGSAHHLLSRKYQQVLLDTCKRFGFQYVRIQELVSNAFIPRVLPDYAYLFQNVSSAITFLYHNHLIPFIELTQYSQEARSMFSTQPAIIKNERFFQLLESFLSYCLAHWPSGWLSKWKFELWFSPMESMEKYVKDFIRIKKLLFKYFPGSSIGGPGFDACFSSYTLEECLLALYQAKVNPDFISIHLNYFTYDTEILQISTDKNLLQKRCKKSRACMQKYFPELSLYITEWTSAYISDLPLSRSRYQAVFICKSLLELQDSCNLLGYQLFMDDTSIQADDSKKYDYWEQGLLSADFIKSPAFYAFDLIKERGAKIISCGSNYLITKKSGEHYHAIAFNYAHFSTSHTGIANQKYNFENIYDIFETATDINISLELYGLSAGFYRITRHLLDKFHGSYLDILIGEYTHSNISHSEFLQYAREPFDIKNEYCLQACIPEERTIYILVKDTLSLPSTIPVHCICTWDIQKLVTV